jgi:hypothetical protein
MLVLLFALFLEVPKILDITEVWLPRHPTTQTPSEFLVVTRHRSDAELHFAWDFGDETTAETTAPGTAHRYAAPDTYFLTVVVTDTHNDLTAKVIRLVTVVAPRQ